MRKNPGKIFLRVLLAGVACALSLVVKAEDVAAHAASHSRPQELVARIGKALRERDYKGVFSYETSDGKANLQWVHAVRDGVERERLLGLDGGHREVLRERPVGCMQRGERAIHTQLMDALSGDLAVLSAYYAFSVDKETIVAGRLADVVVIRPVDAFRYGYRLRVDRETGLLLGADLFDQDQRAVESFHFLSMQVGNVADTDLQPVTSDPLRMDTSQCEQGAAMAERPLSPWQFDLPAGYVLCNHELQRDDDAQQMEDVQTFSDGLNHFTLFVRPLRQKDREGAAESGEDAQLQRGNIRLASRVIQVGGEHYVLTLVGAVPEATVTRVLASVERKDVTSAEHEQSSANARQPEED